MEQLEGRRLLTTMNVWAAPGAEHAAEGGSYSATFTIERAYEEGLTTVAFALGAGSGTFGISAGDAVASGDGVDAANGLITFPGEALTTTVTVTAVDDALMEADESFRLDLFDQADLSTPIGSAEGYVHSNEHELWVEGGGLMTEDDGGSVQFTIHREDVGGAAAAGESVRVRLKTAGDGEFRAELDDYTIADSVEGASAADGVLTFGVDFGAGQSSRTITINAIDDGIVEPEEWFKLVLIDAASNGGGSGGTPPVLSETHATQAFAGIVDDEAQQPQPYHVWVEGPAGDLAEDGQATFTVHRERDNASLTQPYAMNVYLELSALNATPGVDFSPGAWALSGGSQIQVYFDANVDAVEVTFAGIDDAHAQPARSLGLAVGWSSFDPGSYYATPGDLAHPASAELDLADDDFVSQPTGLTVTSFSDTQIDLGWTDNSDNESGFTVQVSTDGGETWADYATYSADTTQASATGLDPNTTYHFRVAAPNAGGFVDFPPTDPPRRTRTRVESPEIPGVSLGTFDIYPSGSPAPDPELPVLQDGVKYRLTVTGASPIRPEPGYDSLPGTDGDAEYGWQGGDEPQDSIDNVDVGLRLSGISEPNAFWGNYDPTYHTYTIDVTGTGEQLEATYAGYEEVPTEYALSLTVERLTPTVWVTAGTGSTTEGSETPATFIVHRDTTFGGAVTVNYTLAGDAEEGVDYTDELGGSVTFGAGDTEAEVAIEAADDETPEWTERIEGEIDAGDDYLLASGEGTDIYMELVDNNDLSIRMPGTPDPIVGYVVWVNDDDDNENDSIDLTEGATASEDPDLVEVTLVTPHAERPGATVTLAADPTKVRVWSSPLKGVSNVLIGDDTSTYTWAAGDVPASVWLETIVASETIGDLALTLNTQDNAGDPADGGCANPSDGTKQQVLTAATIAIRYKGAPAQKDSGSVIIGEPVLLSASVQPAIPNLEYSWTVPDKSAGSWFASRSLSMVFDVVKNNADLHFYWHDHHTGSRTVSVNVKLGAQPPVTRQTNFLTVTPTLQPTTRTGRTVRIIQQIDLNATPDNDPDGTTAGKLEYGTAAIPGFRMYTNGITLPNGYEGTILWVQTTTSEVRLFDVAGNKWRVQKVRDALDNKGAQNFWYDDRQAGTGDDPSSHLFKSKYSTVTRDDHFTLWLMFKPTKFNGIPMDGNLVPLFMTFWNWKGGATWRPVEQDWALIGEASWAEDPQPIPTSDYPIWDSNEADAPFVDVP
ncbi:MAG TPA: Calx-beta domain-containing protein [Tepidisphaeraceae bacterium]|nr:Calx-beta domain-containing protein [Tepidisphaeraceae bacterium]